MFQGLPILDAFVIGALGGLIVFALKQQKRIQIQDRQFRTLLSRLNELTHREQDDFSSPLDGDKS